MEQLQRELKRISDEAAELRQSVQAPVPAASQGTKDEGRGTTDEPRPSESVQSNRGLRPGLQDVTEQFNRQESPAEVRAKLDKLLASASQQQPKQSPPELSQSTVAAEGTRLAGAENPPGTRVQARDQQLITRGMRDDRPAAEIEIEQSRDREGAAIADRRQKADGGPGLPAGQGATSLTALQEVNRLSAQEVSTEAKRVLGGHEDYNSYSANKFEQYFKAGQEYLKQGKYYRAVDAYTLASVYKAGPAGSLGQHEAAALVYAGKSLALFAAGEYISSALFLGRALQAEQLSVANFQFSIPKDKLDSRIADAEECLRLCRETGQQTTVGDLQFLLGYVYLRTGRLADAKRTIDEAYKKLPDSPAVIALKRAIDSAAAGTQPTIK
jgi:tetratricopeptide (TPR) repeat protein